ncbi:MAG: FAD binding domain-containing protein [Anaerolineae bacterium]|nr:FAD binding domain-containing protein [Thermoflexales bacterium]MDW8395932.1 FAD binding domain-containing protein [Anaerolineae bacterium]
MWRDYLIPQSLDQALALLAEHAPQARVIAGGTDLLVEFDRGVRPPCTLIDIACLPALSEITLDEHGWIHLGPLTTHADVVSSALCVDRALPLAQACREVGAPQIRNRATVAGNLITASPANDTIPPLIALDAVVKLRSLRGERILPLETFYTGVRKTLLQPDELLVDISFPALRSDQRGCFLKLGLRRAQAISIVNCAVVISLDGSRCTEARIALGAVAPTIIRARRAEQALRGKSLDAQTIAQAAALAAEASSPIDDVRGSAAYRRDMVKVCVQRALQRIAAGEERRGWSEPPVLLRQLGSAVHAPRPLNGAIQLTVNGKAHTVDNPDAKHKTLLRLLREDCGTVGVKEGCSEGECGACTVILDGRAVMACLVPAPHAHGAEVVTIEGLNQGEGLHPLQQAFIDTGAVQCGYCTPGFIMSGVALLEEHPQPTEAQIKESISGNLCRCTGYYAILDAFRRAAQQLAYEH